MCEAAHQSCYNCECEVKEDDVNEFEKNGYCDDCYAELFGVCDRCDEVVKSNSLEIVVVNGGRSYSWCEDCQKEYSFACCDCGNLTDVNISISNGDEQLCQICYNENYFICEACENTFHNYDYGENGLCVKCGDINKIIYEYDDKTASNMPKLGNPRNNIYFGVELEVESEKKYDRIDNAQKSIDILGDDFCVCKEDGSLSSGHGFEIVTCPASLDIHKERWTKFLGNQISGLRLWDTSGRCGMHVHISKKPLTQLTIGKLLVFINESKNYSFIVKMAGRSCSEYAKIYPKKITDINKCQYDRHEAVNLRPKETIEIRIFRGTLNKERFLANLEFCAAVIEFCKSTSIRGLTDTQFMEFVGNNKKDYPALNSWLILHWR